MVIWWIAARLSYQLLVLDELLQAFLGAWAVVAVDWTSTSRGFQIEISRSVPAGLVTVKIHLRQYSLRPRLNPGFQLRMWSRMANVKMVTVKMVNVEMSLSAPAQRNGSVFLESVAKCRLAEARSGLTQNTCLKFFVLCLVAVKIHTCFNLTTGMCLTSVLDIQPPSVVRWHWTLSYVVSGHVP